MVDDSLKSRFEGIGEPHFIVRNELSVGVDPCKVFILCFMGLCILTINQYLSYLKENKPVICTGDDFYGTLVLLLKRELAYRIPESHIEVVLMSQLLAEHIRDSKDFAVLGLFAQGLVKLAHPGKSVVRLQSIAQLGKGPESSKFVLFSPSVLELIPDILPAVKAEPFAPEHIIEGQVEITEITKKHRE